MKRSHKNPKMLTVEEPKYANSYLLDLLKSKFSEDIYAEWQFKGIGISIIDDKPREILFIGLEKIKGELKQHLESRGEGL
mmetsp:Transcript_34830/g.26002  ORF Transcript_34830/g.26002 Transcript_34830/m.26002 type:complete len:80 (+) Transcript_34830:824-1063(+)